jgi:hypothetical protein
MKETMTNSLLLRLLLILLTLGSAFGQGTIYQHAGYTDPTTEGFIADFDPGSTAKPVTNDFARNAWSITSSAYPATYYQILTAQQSSNLVGADLALSAALRIVQPSNIYMWFSTERLYFWVNFSMQTNGDPILTTRSSITPVFDLTGGGAGYHNYELVYNAASTRASLRVDGVERVTDITGATGYTPWLVGWGAVQGTASQANWSLVEFGGVPEPSSFALFCFGGLVLFWRKLRVGGLRRRRPLKETLRRLSLE